MNKIIAAAAALSMAASTAALAQATAPQQAPADAPPAAVEVKPPLSPAEPTTGATPSHPALEKSAASDTLTLTEAQAKDWVGKTIYSSDGKSVGEVAAFNRDAKGHVIEMHADIGGFLGIGETRVRVTPDQFKLGADRVELTVAAEAAKSLPKVAS
ncbi:MAG: PRC-barrel domain-containing protein [Hyphomicrobiaceae bacterium]|nr:PRC-barrel domain-containing protein [Hyphomicrobiaceae bacterium]